MQLKLEWRDGRLWPVVLERGPRPAPDPYVETLQACLNAAGYACTVDGRFGRGTEEAVRQFQKRSGLEVTGRVDPETARRLGEATAELVGEGGGAVPVEEEDDIRAGPGEDEGGEEEEEREKGKGKKKGKKKKKGKRKKDRKGDA